MAYGSIFMNSLFASLAYQANIFFFFLQYGYFNCIYIAMQRKTKNKNE